jgi:eukaryotic translation initiation factor 4E transporter
MIFCLYLNIVGVPQRIPSPRELQYHTQSIMQNALIRKKLEEQRENFRKRQEQQGGVPSSNVPSVPLPGNGTIASTTLANIVAGTSSSMPPTNLTASSTNNIPSGPVAACIEKPAIASPTLAFTPTSVLRKMTAEKDNDSSSSTAQQNIASSVSASLSSLLSSAVSTSSLASSVSSHPSAGGNNNGNNLLNSLNNSGKNYVAGGGGLPSNQQQQQQQQQRITMNHQQQQLAHMAQLRQQQQQQQQIQGGNVAGGGNIGNSNMNWNLNQLMQMKPQGKSHEFIYQ